MTGQRATRILHVVAGFDTGGTERMALRLISQWQNDFALNAVFLRPGSKALQSSFEDLIDSRNVCASNRESGLLFLWKVAKRVRREVRRLQPHAVIIHSFGLHQVVAAAAVRTARQTAIACIAGNPPPTGRIQRWKWAALLIASRMLNCPVSASSKATFRQLADLRVGLPRGSFPIPNGVDVDEVARCAQLARRQKRGDNFVIGMVARLDPIKDYETLLTGFAQLLSRQAAPAEIWIVGEGPLRPALETFARKLGITASVRFLGGRTDVVELLAQMDVFAFSTTEAEGFGIVLIEAMAAGVPVVASDVAACREVLEQGKFGRLVPPADPEALCRELERLMIERDFAKELAIRASAHVRQTYDIKICADSWLKILGISDLPSEQSGGRDCCKRAVSTTNGFKEP